MRPEYGGLYATRLEADRVIVIRVPPGTAQRMPLRETHRHHSRAGTRRCADEFREFDRIVDTFRRPQFANGDSRITRFDQRLGNTPRLGATDARNLGRHVVRYLQVTGFLFLQFGIEYHECRSAGRRDRLPVSFLHSHECFCERLRMRIPFGDRANDTGHVIRCLRAVKIGVVPADDQEDRRLILICLVNRHRCMHQAKRAVQHDRHRPAFRLGVAVRHIDRGLLVQGRYELRHLVGWIAVVDD